MEEKTMLSEDGRIIRVDNPWWSFYIDTKLAPELDKHRSGNGCSSSMILSSQRMSAVKRLSVRWLLNASTVSICSLEHC